MAVDIIARGMAAEALSGGGGGGGSSTLAGLTDVDLSNPSDGQTLVYNATSQKWVNGNGSVLVVHETVEGTTHTLDKTWQQIHDAALPVVIFDEPDGAGTMRGWNTFINVSDDNYVVNVDGISYFSGTASGYPSSTE